MHKKHLIAVAVATGLAYFPVNANEYQATMVSVPQSKAIKDTYIVVFNTPSVLNLSNNNTIAEFAVKQAESLVNQYDVRVMKNFGNVLNGVLINASAQQVKALLKDPNVKYVEQDQVMSVTPMMEANADQPSPTWGIDRIDQRNLPLDNNYHTDYDGSGVTAFVIDTGVLNTHNEFGGRASSGYDFIDNDYDATDCNGHGTHVAGRLAAQPTVSRKTSMWWVSECLTVQVLAVTLA